MTVLNCLRWMVLMLIFLITMLNDPVYCDIKPPTKFQTQNGVRSVHALSQLAASWATKTSNAAKAAAVTANAAKDTAKYAGSTAKAAAKAATKAAKVAGTLFKAINMIGKMAPYIGVLGFLAPFLQSLLGGENPQMKLMKKEFFELNNKLDKISDTLDKMDSKITFESQRSAYVGSQAKITESYRQMKVMIDELKNSTCKKSYNDKECARDRIGIYETYKDKFKDIEKELATIFVPGASSMFKDPIMNLARIQYECDIPIMTETFERLFSLARKGQTVVTVYHRIHGSKISLIESTAHWSKVMYNFRESFYNNVNLCFKSIVGKLPSDLPQEPGDNPIVKDLKKKSGSTVRDIRDTLDYKYSWLRWVRNKILCLIYIL